MTEKKMAPWLDFAGAPIHEGDTIQHPSGEHGQVVFLPSYHEVADQWRVRYEGDSTLSRLCLQVGTKGMAVVVHAPQYAHFGRGRSMTVTYANRHEERHISSALAEIPQATAAGHRGEFM
jgi:hypothetical protein